MSTEAGLLREAANRLLMFLDANFNGSVMAWIRSEDQRRAQQAAWMDQIHGLNEQQLRRGCLQAKRMDRAPTPQQFRKLCVGDGSHQITKALPAPEIDRNAQRHNAERIRQEAQKRAGKMDMRRCLTRPGYGPNEHAAQVQAGKAKGVCRWVVDMAAMRYHGWQAVDEMRYHAAARHLRRELYLPGHEPPAWVSDASLADAPKVQAWLDEQIEILNGQDTLEAA